MPPEEAQLGGKRKGIDDSNDHVADANAIEVGSTAIESTGGWNGSHLDHSGTNVIRQKDQNSQRG
jgi:hypothetical protein